MSVPLSHPGLNRHYYEVPAEAPFMLWLIEEFISSLHRKRYSFMTVQFTGTRSTKRINTTRKLADLFIYFLAGWLFSGFPRLPVMSWWTENGERESDMERERERAAGFVPMHRVGRHRQTGTPFNLGNPSCYMCTLLFLQLYSYRNMCALGILWFVIRAIISIRIVDYQV